MNEILTAAMAIYRVVYSQCPVFQIRCLRQRKESGTWGVGCEVDRLRRSARILLTNVREWEQKRL